MLNIYKYNYFIELENKYQNYFKYASNITLLPPILKKVGVIYYLAFMVVEKTTNTVKRPIGIILINKVTGQEKVYDIKDYDFIPDCFDFEYEYYNIELCPSYYPNITPKMEEYIKVNLDKLAYASKGKYFNIDENKYNEYLNRIKIIFPTQYFTFFENLQNNEIIQIDDRIRAKRDLYKIKNSLNKTSTNNQRIIENIINKKNFKKIFRKLITDYIKKNIIPSLKGKGSFNKINFYYNFGEYYKNFEKHIHKHYECYGFEFDEHVRQKNIDNFFEKEKEEIKKLMYSCLNISFSKNITIDTLSKILIIFLNSLLIEKIHNAVIEDFEQQIEECVEIFNENKDKNFDNNAKQFLFKIYNELLNDYNIKDDNNFSNTYYGYLVTHFPFDL